MHKISALFLALPLLAAALSALCAPTAAVDRIRLPERDVIAPVRVVKKRVIAYTITLIAAFRKMRLIL